MNLTLRARIFIIISLIILIILAISIALIVISKKNKAEEVTPEDNVNTEQQIKVDGQNNVTGIQPVVIDQGLTIKPQTNEEKMRLASENIAKIFIERYGSGITKVRSLLKKNGNRDLEYELHKIETRVVVYSQVYEMDKTTLKTTLKNDEKILEIIRRNPKITKEDISEHLKIGINGVKYHIKNLRKQGKLEWIGSTKKGYWEVIENEK